MKKIRFSNVRLLPTIFEYVIVSRILLFEYSVAALIWRVPAADSTRRSFHLSFQLVTVALPAECTQICRKARATNSQKHAPSAQPEVS